MRTPGKGFTSLHTILSVTARHGASSDSRAKEETPPLRGRRGGEPATPVTLPSVAPGHVLPGVRSRSQCVCEASPLAAVPRGFRVSVLTYKVTGLLGSIVKSKETL